MCPAGAPRTAISSRPFPCSDIARSLPRHPATSWCISVRSRNRRGAPPAARRPRQCPRGRSRRQRAFRSKIFQPSFSGSFDPVKRLVADVPIKFIVGALAALRIRGSPEPFPFRLNRNGALSFCFDAFSSREPGSTSLENTLKPPQLDARRLRAAIELHLDVENKAGATLQQPLNQRPSATDIAVMRHRQYDRI